MPKQFPPLLSSIEKILSFFEKERFGILSLFIWIVVLSAIRMWTEAYLLDYPYKELSYYYLFWQGQITCFFITVFIGGTLILRFYTKQKLAKVANLCGLGFLMVLVPPFLDVFILHSSQGYNYISPFQFIEAFVTLGTSQNINWGGMGVIFELLGITVATSLYVFLRTFRKGLLKSLTYTILNAFTFILLFLVAGAPLILILGKYAGFLLHPIFLIRYISISIILLLLILKITKKGLLTSFIRSSRLLTTAHFALMTAVGVLIAGHLHQIGSFHIDILNMFDRIFLQLFMGNVGTFLLSLLTIIFVWQYAVMINHVYDVTIDKLDNKDRLIPKGMMTRRQVKKIAIVYALISLGLSSVLGVYSFLLVIVGLFFGTIYSVPPLRLRDSVFSTAIIGIGSSIAYFLGYVTPAYIKVMHGELAGQVMRTCPEFTTDSIVIGILIFIALTVGPLIKDYKDYEGDKKAGVKNLFTIYGLEKGVNITSFLLPVPFFCLLLLFHSLVDIIIIFPLGLLAGILFKIFRNTKLVFAIYFPLIIYCLLRWFEVINF